MDGPVAITREVSPDLAACELTHQARVPIDIGLARAQHRGYVNALSEAGCSIEQLPAEAGMPDAVFVEDTAVVLDELAIMMRPGAESRRGEVAAVARALSRYRRLESIAAPATADGGDVLVSGPHVFVGRSTRTNGEAIEQMRDILAPYGYAVCEAVPRDCLHLKSAATSIGRLLLLVNPGWIDTTVFAGFTCVAVDPDEPAAANALWLADRVIFPSVFPKTAERLRRHGVRVCTVNVAELAKAEGAVTCCSLIVPARQD
jgi:dimethylargininase